MFVRSQDIKSLLEIKGKTWGIGNFFSLFCKCQIANFDLKFETCIF